MLAMTYKAYGDADVVTPQAMPRPVPGKAAVLVKVGAAGVTTADWRLRASAFPGGLWLVGRLVTGLFRPRHPVLGGDFAGTVVATGPDVAQFQPGDRVFGFCGHGAHAQYLTIDQKGAVACTPESMTDIQAAALPFGGIAALSFLKDVAKLRAGQSVLIIGASGGVGSLGVQVAKDLGAEVTGVASGENLDFVRGLGADHVVDYRATDIPELTAKYDLVFDTFGAISFKDAKRILKRDGVFLPLNFGLPDVVRMLRAKLVGGPRMVLHVNPDRAEDVETLAEMVGRGVLTPVVDQVYPFMDIHAAYAHVETRHRKGAVVLDISGAS